MKQHKIQLNINGKDCTFEVSSNKTLIELLRNDLSLLGTKHSCLEGECGACTIIMNGKAILSCLVLAVEADNAKITTIEGLKKEDGAFHPIQQAFIDKGAIQCGFCTPAMIMTAKAFLDKNSNPSRQDIEMAINGNLCRCTGYIKIVDAIEEAAKRIDCNNGVSKG